MSLFVAKPQPDQPLPQQTVKVELDPLTFSLKVFPEAVEVVPGRSSCGSFRICRRASCRGSASKARRDAARPLPGSASSPRPCSARCPSRARPGLYKYRLLVRSRTGTTREQGHAAV